MPQGALISGGADRYPRVQEIAIPILRAALPDVTVTSWIPDIDYRKYPVVNVRRLGGYRDFDKPQWLDWPVIELTAYGVEGLPETEVLYTRCLDALFHAWKRQIVTPAGHLCRVRETMGQTQFSSLFQDSYRVQGLIELGVRAPAKGLI